VEIGSYSGGSTEMFALNVKQVYSIDPYADNDSPLQEGNTLEIALANLSNAEKVFTEKMAKYENVTKIRKLSMDAVDDFEDGSLDAVYIDGNHKYDSVCNDINKWMPKLKNGGIISGHDYFENVKLAVDNTLGVPLKTYDDRSWMHIKGDYTLIKTTYDDEFGLFALILQVVGVLSKEKETYVDFKDNRSYYEKSYGENPWEYYFEQPCGKDLKTLYDKINKDEIKNYKADIFNSCSIFSVAAKTLNRPGNDLEKIRNIIIDKIRIKPHIQEKIDSFYALHMMGYKILGIQKRGTDLYYMGRAQQLFDIKDAFIEIALQIDNYDKLFLITDEQPTLELFRERYGDKLIHYDDASLSPHEASIHRGGSTDSKYKIGKDVIIETELLAKVDYLLAMNSNLSLWAILKGVMPYHFIDKHIEYIG
ncbi:unnamed protein product, partial [marine sediment metagenome]